MNKLFQQLADGKRAWLRRAQPLLYHKIHSLRSIVVAALALATSAMQKNHAVFQFSLWSLRRRVSQIVPVGIAFLLLVCTMQSIGALHDTSSTMTRQKIAQHWRTPYDLLVRLQSAVSLPERNAGWIDPQSVLENYGGISPQQIASIATLSHVAEVIPFADIGWQSVAVQLPVELVTKGIYRVTASWIGPRGEGAAGSEIVRYVDVTDLAHLTSEMPLDSPILVHLIARDDKTPVVFPMSIPAIQALIGVSMSQQTTLSQLLFEDTPSTTAVHLSLHVNRLLGDMTMLPACVYRSECWEAQQVRQGAIHYLADGVLLLRYSRTNYTASPQQLAAGQVSVAPSGKDMQGFVFRFPLVTHVPMPESNNAGYPQEVPQHVLPLSGPERLPLMTDAFRFVPLEQACTVNGANCYSGLYIRLNGVEQYGQQSLALLQSTAAAITARTGLHVDILDGSSLRNVSISTSTDAGSPVQSSWRVVGVAVQIVHGVDALQQTLLVLCTIVCLLAIGAAGALVGIGRRKDALLLQQLGWPTYLLVCIFALDALILSLPGFLLAMSWMILASTHWPGSLSPVVIWILFIGGFIVYCCSLVCIASLGTTSLRLHVTHRGGSGAFRDRYMAGHRGPRRGGGREDEGRGPLWPPASYSHDRNTLPSTTGGHKGPHSTSTPLPPLREDARSQAVSQIPTLERPLPTPPLWMFRAFRQFSTAMPSFICSLAVTSATFLIAIEYVLVASFNQVLVVTVLGNQVREALEAPQLVLLLLLLGAALLTVSLCATLMLRGRREEISLLSMVGWERRAVLLRLMWDCWWPALLSGEAGGLLVLGLTMLAGELPPLAIIVGLLGCTPLIGVLLVSLAAFGPAWQETKRVFLWS